MTMKYTHIGMDDQAKAVANLPVPKAPKSDHRPAALAARPTKPALHERCISRGFGRLSLSTAGNEEEAKKRHNCPSSAVKN
jgi:hypothetical protein